MEACVAIYRMNRFADDHLQHIGVVHFERTHYVDLDQVMVQLHPQAFRIGILITQQF